MAPSANPVRLFQQPRLFYGHVDRGFEMRRQSRPDSGDRRRRNHVASDEQEVSYSLLRPGTGDVRQDRLGHSSAKLLGTGDALMEGAQVQEEG